MTATDIHREALVALLRNTAGITDRTERLARFKALSEQHADQSLAWRGRAKMLWRAGEHTTALPHYRRAVLLDTAARSLCADAEEGCVRYPSSQPCAAPPTKRPETRSQPSHVKPRCMMRPCLRRGKIYQPTRDVVRSRVLSDAEGARSGYHSPRIDR